jgi:hypothetical protein
MKVVDFTAPSCSHAFTTAPSVFTAWRTIILAPKRSELRCDSARTCSGPVSSFFAASNVAATAFVRIWRFIDPSEFGAILSMEE